MAFRYGYCDGFSDALCGPEASSVVVAPGRLGCSTHVAYVQDKCNGPRLCELIDASSITYNRRLDDISTAVVIVPMFGDSENPGPCCECLGKVEPWCHQLTIVREGDGVVWTGPIQKITYGSNDVVIEASDKLAWLQYRVNELGLCYSSACGGVDNTTIPLTQIAEDIITLAMADDGDSPCFTDCIVIPPSPDPLLATDGLPLVFDRQFFFEAFGGPTAYDDLVQLGNAGIDFTVINQCLVLTGENLPTRAIGILTDEMILGDVHIIKDGTSMGNRFFVRYEGDDDPVQCKAQCDAGCGCNCPQCSDPIVTPCYLTPCPGFAETNEADQFCYGSIERVIDNVGAQDVETANGVAARYLARGKIAPRQIELPSGTRLSPDAPWGINDMICGQRIDVAISKLCFSVFQSFKLQGMEVTDDGTDEQITVDLVAVEQTSS